MTDPPLDIEIAPLPEVSPADQPIALILDTWARSASSFPVPKVPWHNRRTRELAHALIHHHDKPSDRVLVAHLPGAPDVCVGWACFGGRGVLHYVYVKGNYRRSGVATRLVGAAPAPITAMSRPPTYKHVQDWARRLGWQYDPFTLVLPATDH